MRLHSRVYQCLVSPMENRVIQHFAQLMEQVLHLFGEEKSRAQVPAEKVQSFFKVCERAIAEWYRAVTKWRWVTSLEMAG